jgi:hypothetical protein
MLEHRVDQSDAVEGLPLTHSLATTVYFIFDLVRLGAAIWPEL